MATKKINSEHYNSWIKTFDELKCPNGKTFKNVLQFNIDKRQHTLTESEYEALSKHFKYHKTEKYWYKAYSSKKNMLNDEKVIRDSFGKFFDNTALPTEEKKKAKKKSKIAQAISEEIDLTKLQIEQAQYSKKSAKKNNKTSEPVPVKEPEKPELPEMKTVKPVSEMKITEFFKDDLNFEELCISTEEYKDLFMKMLDHAKAQSYVIKNLNIENAKLEKECDDYSSEIEFIKSMAQ